MHIYIYICNTISLFRMGFRAKKKIRLGIDWLQMEPI